MATISSAGILSPLAYGNVTIAGMSASIPSGNVTCGYNEQCPVSQQMGSSGTATMVNNQPVIEGLFSADWYPGLTQQVTYQGEYFGTNAPTLGFNPSAGITYSLQNYNDNQIVANVYVAQGTPNENVALTVTNNGYGGQAFTSGGGMTTPTSTPVNAMIYNPQAAYPDITVVGWIDKTAPDLASISTSGVNPVLLSVLVEGSPFCTEELIAWVTTTRADILTQADVNYVNLWLLEHTANTPPPTTTLPAGFENSKSNFRLYGDWGGQPTQVGSSQQIGATLDPCHILPSSDGDNSTYMGYYQPPTAKGNSYKVFEGRAGAAGQAGYTTITGGRTLPFIYGIVGFTSSGTPISLIHTTFPTFYVYKNGVYLTTFPQGQGLQFLNGSDATNQHQWSPLN